MNFGGTPTPVFYEIVFVLIFAMVMVAGGLNALRAVVLSVLISYVLFIAYVGGFSSSEAFAMGAGWGVLLMIPVSIGAGLAAGVGSLIRSAITRGEKQTED